MNTYTHSADYSQFVLLCMYQFTTQWNSHSILCSSWLNILMLSLCWSMQYVWFIQAGCSIKSCHPLRMLLKLELPLQNPLPILQEVWVNVEDRPSAFLIHWFSISNHTVYQWQLSKSWSLTPFATVVLILFSIPLLHLMSLNSNNQQSGWIVHLVEYSPGYQQSLIWRVAWHSMCGIW